MSKHIGWLNLHVHVFVICMHMKLELGDIGVASVELFGASSKHVLHVIEVAFSLYLQDCSF
jgi:hypothetical protein